MPTFAAHDALPAGARLGEFEIEQVLGVGGFGVVYLAMDHALQRQVAIKEYMPSALAGRGEGSQVVVRSAAHADTFALGLQSFINEARLLARFDHPALVKVYRFWEDHGTAYMVMPYYQGQTLQQVRRGMSGPPDEAWLRRLINPLLGALDCLHRENVFHRDIAPDNILLLDSEAGPATGPPVLLDLGAARRVIGDHTQVLTAILKPSFAPIEQYAETVQLRQGPWTDLYALAAVVHFCITGRPPMPATARAVHDELPLLAQMRASLAADFDCHFSESFVHAIDHALALRPQDRPDNVAAWRSALSGIVGRQIPQGEAGSEAQALPQTVLVRQAGQDTAPGHLAVAAEAFMTTIPAAGRLAAAPPWQGRRTETLPTSAVPADGPRAPAKDEDAGAGAGDVGGQRVPAPSAQATPPPAKTEGEGVWLRGGVVAGLMLAVMAVWWSQRVAHEGPPEDGRAPAASAVAIAPAPVESTEHTEPRDPPQALARAPAARPARATPAPVPSAQPSDKDTLGDGVLATAEPLDPRKPCAGRNFISMAICMKRHCSRPAYADHPACERMRQQEAAQRPNY